MKAKLLALLLALAYALTAQAQGTFQFSVTLTGSQEVPPNNDPTVGWGTFTLDVNVLNFLVDVPSDYFLPESAYIEGPAPVGETAPKIFNLGYPIGHSGTDFGTPPFVSFFSPFDGVFGAGPFTLTDTQTQQLMDGLWYVNVTSAANPNGEIRGQIQLVPEPSIAALGGLCALIVFDWRLRLKRVKGVL